MSTSRKIQLALVASLLWSSTSVSSFAATNTITPGKNQSVTVKIPVESIPSRQLNLTPDTNLIAQNMRSLRSMLSQVPGGYDTFKMFDEMWKNRADRKNKFIDYCNTQKLLPIDRCFAFILIWTQDMDSYENVRNLQRQDFIDLNDITMAAVDIRREMIERERNQKKP